MMSPKQRLIAQTPLAEDVRKILHGTVFEVACETALLEFIYGQGRANEGGSAISSHYELEGAKRFLTMLCRITDDDTRGIPLSSGLDFAAMTERPNIKPEPK